jgi:hypothetical protein
MVECNAGIGRYPQKPCSGNMELVQSAGGSYIMESCDECLRLEQWLRGASEHYVSLTDQHNQMIRQGKPEASTLDNAIKRARRRRNAAGRLLLYHRIKHLAPITASIPVISITFWGVGKLSERSTPRYHYLQSFAPPKNEEEVRTVAQYQVKDPMLAISDQSGGKRDTVTIPVGAVIHDSSTPTTTLLGLVGVYWEGRHYSVSFRDLLKKAQCVKSA